MNGPCECSVTCLNMRNVFRKAVILMPSTAMICGTDVVSATKHNDGVTRQPWGLEAICYFPLMQHICFRSKVIHMFVSCSHGFIKNLKAQNFVGWI